MYLLKHVIQDQFLLNIREIKRNLVDETASPYIDQETLLTRQNMEGLYNKLRKEQEAL